MPNIQFWIGLTLGGVAGTAFGVWISYLFWRETLRQAAAKGRLIYKRSELRTDVRGKS